MKRILFVDDEENVLQGLKVMLHSLRGAWTMMFAQSGQEALDIMEKEEPFDVVVSDMHMPGMHGAEFLKKVMEVSPQTVRFVLSGNLDGETLVRSSCVAHQILAKPCDSNVLRSVIARAFTLRERLNDCSLKEALLEMGSLPSVPVIYWEILNEINSPEPSIERVGKIIEKDPGMSAKVLQIVNVHAGPGRHVSNIPEAVSILGLDNMKSFVLMAEIFSQYEQDKAPEGFSIDDLWQHGLSVGQYAKIITEFETDDKETQDQAYTAGLLHDIGLLILASKLPQEFRRAMDFAAERQIPLQQAEKDLFGATHAEVGGYLLDLWGLPDPVVSAISNHFYPSATPDETYESFDDTDFTPLTAVHVANYFSEDNEVGPSGAIPAQVDTVHLDRLGLSDKLTIWWDMCLRFT